MNNESHSRLIHCAIFICLVRLPSEGDYRRLLIKYASHSIANRRDCLSSSRLVCMHQCLPSGLYSGQGGGGGGSVTILIIDWGDRVATVEHKLPHISVEGRTLCWAKHATPVCHISNPLSRPPPLPLSLPFFLFVSRPLSSPAMPDQ